MTIVKVTCPDCGDLDLEVWQLVVVSTEGQFTFEFTCSECEQDVRRATDEATAQRLAAAGVRVTEAQPAISCDDIARATAYLRNTDLLVADILALPSED